MYNSSSVCTSFEVPGLSNRDWKVLERRATYPGFIVEYPVKVRVVGERFLYACYGRGDVLFCEGKDLDGHIGFVCLLCSRNWIGLGLGKILSL